MVPRMPAIPGLKVVKSGIHGYGVVATRDFEVGEKVADVEGVLYHEDDVEDDRYCLWMDEGWYLDMVDQTRWVNHSCEPNIEIEGELERDGGYWARLVAIRPIKAGEELVYDYAFSPELAEPCACGTPKCRGWIVDPDEALAAAPSSQAAISRATVEG